MQQTMHSPFAPTTSPAATSAAARAAASLDTTSCSRRGERIAVDSCPSTDPDDDVPHPGERNVIDDKTRAEILRLYFAEAWPIATIASELSVHHDVVERVLASSDNLRAPSERSSKLDPFLSFIRETLQEHPNLRASRLYDMCVARGYDGGPDHFRHAIRRLRPRPAAEAYLRLSTLPGEEAQVDWAHFGRVVIGRARRQLVAFVMVLSWSRMIFMRFFLGAPMECFVRGHVCAFAFFGGAARIVLYDNLRSAVSERRGDAIRFHRR